MSKSKYTEPDQNIVVALAKGVFELPSTFIKINKDPAYSKHTLYAKWEITLLKTFIKNLHYKQLLFFSPNKSIKSQLKSTKSKHGSGLNNYGKEIEGFPNAVWLAEKPGREPEDPVIIFYHGGGYLFQFRSDTHLVYLVNLAKKLPSHSILIVDYPLSSHPAPLNYNLDLWSYLFKKENLQNVITMGDSAGGHLILSSLASLKLTTSSMQLPKLFKHVLISPWIDLSSIAPPGENHDILDHDRSYGWGEIFSHNNEPIDVANADYGGLLDEHNTLVTVGELEMLRAGIEIFANRYDLPILLESQGVHDQITMEKFLGYKEGDIFDSIVDFCN